MSRLPFELLLALRYLRPKRTFVSVITLISVLGVMLGVAVLIVVLSVMTGFDHQLRDKILGFNAHLRIVQGRSPMRDYQRVMRQVQAKNHVKAVAPFVLGQVMIETEPKNGSPLAAAPWVRGVDPRYETNVSILATNIVLGEFNLSGDSVLVGTDLVHNLELGLGDRITVHSPNSLKKMRKNAKTETEEAFFPEEFVVRGIFDVGYYEYNATVIVMGLGNAQDLYGLNDDVHGLMVML